MTADIIHILRENPKGELIVDPAIPNLPPFPEIWDSTIRSAFANCYRKGYWEFIRKRRRPGGNIHLLFGGCFAKAMEIARKSFYVGGKSQDVSIIEAIIAATDMWETGDGDALVPHRGPPANKTYAGLVDAIASYFERWPLENAEVVPLRLPNGDLFIEKTFAFPVEGTSHPITGKPVIFAGRLDMLGTWEGGGDLIIGVDEKTSGYLGDSWAANWPMRGQITAYCYGSALFGYRIRSFHIRGIGILKTDITFAPDLQNRRDWQLRRWLQQTKNYINRASDLYIRMVAEQEANGFDGKHMEDHWDINEDQACSAYGGCPYMDLCTSEHPERWLNNYEVVDWNPLATRED